MIRRSEPLIWGGVVGGLNHCQSSDTPLLALGEHLGQLRRMGWHPADIRAVECSILELLRWNPEDKTVTAPGNCLAVG